MQQDLLYLRLAADGENLFDQPPRPVAGKDDLFYIPGGKRSRLAVLPGHFRIPEDRPEDIVEVVGDPPRQGADGLHLLGLTEFGLEPLAFLLGLLPFSDITDDTGKLPRCRAEGRDLEIFPQRPGVVLEKYRNAAQRHSTVRLDPIPFDLRQDLEHRPADYIRRIKAGHPLEGRVDGDKPIIRRRSGLVDDDLVQGEAVEHLVEKRLVIPFRLTVGRHVPAQ